MAKITITSDTATRDVTFDLPHNARLVVVDGTTKDILYSIGVDGARKLIFTDDLTVVACEPDTGEKDTWLDEICDDDTCNADDAEDNASEDVASEDVASEDVASEDVASEDVASKDDTRNADDAEDDASEDNIDADKPHNLICEGERTESDEYVVSITRGTDGELFNPVTNRPMSDEEFVNLIVTAERHDAKCAMTFDIPERGVTTFTGAIHHNYSSWGMAERPGFSIVGNQGGSLIVDEEMRITQDVTVLTRASVIFTTTNDNADDEGDEGNAQDEPQDNTPDADATPATEPQPAIDEAEQARIEAAPVIENADGKVFFSVDVAKLNDNSVVLLREALKLASYKQLSVIATSHSDERVFVGKGNYDNEDDTFALRDNTNGVILIRVDDLDTLRDSGIETVEVFSDGKMRRNGFAGLNNDKYAEIPLITFLAHMEA